MLADSDGSIDVSRGAECAPRIDFCVRTYAVLPANSLTQDDGSALVLLALAGTTEPPVRRRHTLFAVPALVAAVFTQNYTATDALSPAR